MGVQLRGNLSVLDAENDLTRTIMTWSRLSGYSGSILHNVSHSILPGLDLGTGVHRYIHTNPLSIIDIPTYIRLTDIPILMIYIT